MPWRRRSDTLFRRVPDGVVVINLDGGDPIWLAAPGDEIWRLLSTERTLDELADDLAEQYGASATPATVRDDCRATLEALVDCGVVVSSDDEEPVGR
jgi:hypothetical protein